MTGKRLLDVWLWLVAMVGGSALLLVLIVLAVNRNDRPPSDVALRFAEAYRNRAPVADEDNGYVYDMGFSVGKTADPREWGVKRIAWARQVMASTMDLDDEVSQRELPGGTYDVRSLRPKAIKEVWDACQNVDRACLDALSSNDAAIETWISSEQWLLARYRTLLRHPGWLETLPYDVRLPLPAYAQVMEGQRLLLLNAWKLAGEGDAAGVRELLTEDARHWRLRLAASDTLISKMMTVAALQRHLLWANIIFRRLGPERAIDAVPPLWREPISDAERSMQRCLVGEWEFFDRTAKATTGATREWLFAEYVHDEANFYGVLLALAPGLLIQPQDSSNKQAELLNAIAGTLEVPYLQYEKALERARAMEREAQTSTFPRRAYNIAGDYFFFRDLPTFTSYAARVADMEGLRRAALLAVEWRSRELSPDQISEHLHQAEIRNPYSGKPFVWDQKRAAIVFTSVERQGETTTYALLY